MERDLLARLARRKWNDIGCAKCTAAEAYQVGKEEETMAGADTHVRHT